MTTVDISITIPVFNDHYHLEELLGRIFQVASEYRYKLEVILVDDGSLPETWQHMLALKQKYSDKSLKLIRLKKNHGQHFATICGLKESVGKILVTMDADLQHYPEDIPYMVATLTAQQSELVYGISTIGHPWPHRIASQAFFHLTRPLGIKRVKGSSFRCFSADLFSRITPWTEGYFSFIDDYFPRSTQKIQEIEVHHFKREKGASRYTLASRITQSLQVIAYCSSWRQKLLGIALAVISLVAGGILISQKGMAFGVPLLTLGILLVFWASTVIPLQNRKKETEKSIAEIQ